MHPGLTVTSSWERAFHLGLISLNRDKLSYLIACNVFKFVRLQIRLLLNTPDSFLKKLFELFQNIRVVAPVLESVKASIPLNS
jgi:hypothetical protein